MAPLARPYCRPAPGHRAFVDQLSRLDNVLRFHFRRLPSGAGPRRSPTASAAAWHAWAGLLERGKDPIESGRRGSPPTP